MLTQNVSNTQLIEDSAWQIKKFKDSTNKKNNYCTTIYYYYQNTQIGFIEFLKKINHPSIEAKIYFLQQSIPNILQRKFAIILKKTGELLQAEFNPSILTNEILCCFPIAKINEFFNALINLNCLNFASYISELKTFCMSNTNSTYIQPVTTSPTESTSYRSQLETFIENYFDLALDNTYDTDNDNDVDLPALEDATFETPTYQTANYINFHINNLVRQMREERPTFPEAYRLPTLNTDNIYFNEYQPYFQNQFLDNGPFTHVTKNQNIKDILNLLDNDFPQALYCALCFQLIDNPINMGTKTNPTWCEILVIMKHVSEKGTNPFTRQKMAFENLKTDATHQNIIDTHMQPLQTLYNNGYILANFYFPYTPSFLIRSIRKIYYSAISANETLNPNSCTKSLKKIFYKNTYTLFGLNCSLTLDNGSKNSKQNTLTTIGTSK